MFVSEMRTAIAALNWSRGEEPIRSANELPYPDFDTQPIRPLSRGSSMIPPPWISIRVM